MSLLSPGRPHITFDHTNFNASQHFQLLTKLQNLLVFQSKTKSTCRTSSTSKPKASTDLDPLVHPLTIHGVGSNDGVGSSPVRSAADLDHSAIDQQRHRKMTMTTIMKDQKDRNKVAPDNESATAQNNNDHKAGSQEANDSKHT